MINSKSGTSNIAFIVCSSLVLLYPFTLENRTPDKVEVIAWLIATVIMMIITIARIVYSNIQRKKEKKALDERYKQELAQEKAQDQEKAP